MKENNFLKHFLGSMDYNQRVVTYTQDRAQKILDNVIHQTGKTEKNVKEMVTSVVELSKSNQQCIQEMMINCLNGSSCRVMSEEELVDSYIFSLDGCKIDS